MATQTPITELDFDNIKSQLKSYLRQQDKFVDYNFEGSNMSVLLDVLAYNTYQNNFYTNMAINEMFLDSALLRNSVVSHAKELNYLPRSRRSAKATVTLTIRDNDGILEGQTVSIPAYTDFNSTFQGENFNFVTAQTYVARKTGVGVYQAANIELFEGEYLTSFEREGFIVDADGILRVAITNENADTDSFEVFVDAEATDDANVYLYAKDIFGVGPTDKVFYVEPYLDNRYSIYFGGNVYGEQPSEFEDVRVRYRICSGTEANGASVFTTNFIDNVTATVTTLVAANGGQERESLESIKAYAPKSLQIQERAVTTKDYETLLKQRFPEINAVAAYGGEELDPPQFGKVAVAVYLRDGDELISSSLANRYVEYLRDKTPLTIEPIFIQTSFVYACVTAKIYYSKRLTTLSPGDLEQLVRAKIQAHSAANLADFGKKLRMSGLSTEVDAVDNGIQSVNITAVPLIDWSPDLGIASTVVFRFQSELVKPYPYTQDTGFTDYKPAVKSSVFNITGSVPVYIQDDGLGNIMVISDSPSDPQVLNPKVGTVSYTTGEVKLTKFAVESFTGSAIKIEVNTVRRDITAPTGRIFLIRDEDVHVEIFAEEELNKTASSQSVATAGGIVITTV
jgi:hypothetical protein